MRLSDGVQHVVIEVIKMKILIIITKIMVPPIDPKLKVVFMITYIIMLLLVLLVGKYLWNNILTNLVTVVKPAYVVDILGLLLIAILNL